MYSWYRESAVCYIYLADLSLFQVVQNASGWITEVPFETLKTSRWFYRGWTLQELIAPDRFEFFCAEWKPVKTETLVKDIASITRIDSVIFTDKSSLKTYSVAQKMAWAATRKTTRIEDMAYCLFGIFDVNMPLLYGEGSKAFRRLQEELLKTTEDQSIFFWGLKSSETIIPTLFSNDTFYFDRSDDGTPGLHYHVKHTMPKLDFLINIESDKTPLRGLLALSPKDFQHCLRVSRMDSLLADEEGMPTVLRNSISIRLPIIRILKSRMFGIAILSCAIDRCLLGVVVSEWSKRYVGRLSSSIFISNPSWATHGGLSIKRLSPPTKPPILQTLQFKEQDCNFDGYLVQIDVEISSDTQLDIDNSTQPLQDRSLGSKGASKSIVLSLSGAAIGLQALLSIHLSFWHGTGQRLYIELANFLVDDGTNIRNSIWFRSSWATPQFAEDARSQLAGNESDEKYERYMSWPVPGLIKEGWSKNECRVESPVEDHDAWLEIYLHSHLLDWERQRRNKNQIMDRMVLGLLFG